MFKLPPGDSTAPVQVTYKGGIIDHEQLWYFDHSVTFKVSFHNCFVIYNNNNNNNNNINCYLQ